MAGFHTHLEEATLENNNFRKVIFTGEYQQLVLMSIKPGSDIGMETHPTVDQFIRIEAGEGKAVIDGEEFSLKDGSAIVIPAGSKHNVLNVSSSEDLKLYTVYAPPNHPKGTVHKTRDEAMAAEEHEHEK